jgi:hypothetical protein
VFAVLFLYYTLFENIIFKECEKWKIIIRVEEIIKRYEQYYIEALEQAGYKD